MLLKVTNLGIVTIPVGKAVLGCLRINLKIKEWSLKLTSTSSSECDIVTGKHVTMLETKTLKKLSDPFLLPFTDALYIQIAATGSKVCSYSPLKYYMVQQNTSLCIYLAMLG